MKIIVETLGIDLSKSTPDAFFHESKVQEQFESNTKDFQAMLTRAHKTGKVKFAQLLICFEHTGIYGMELAYFLEKFRFQFEKEIIEYNLLVKAYSLNEI